MKFILNADQHGIRITGYPSPGASWKKTRRATVFSEKKGLQKKNFVRSGRLMWEMAKEIAGWTDIS